jgi:diguanylate cyclase (GGDEF)-like protein
MSELDFLKEELAVYKKKFNEFTKIVIALNKETNLDELLSNIVFFGKKFTNADAGTLYFYHKTHLGFSAIQNSSLDIDMNRSREFISWDNIPVKDNMNLASVYCAVNRELINISDVYENVYYDFEGTKNFDKKTGYRTKSMLVVPIVDGEKDEVIGVLQLLNKLDDSGNVISFTAEDSELSLSLASQSAAVLVRLKGELENLRKLNLKLEKQRDELDYLANTDQLTKVANRLKFNTEYTKAFLEASKDNVPLAFIILDIDHFKSVNDTFGHKVGDYVLSKMAKVISDFLSDDVLFARWGGEEFVILLPNKSYKNAVELAEKVRVEINECLFDAVSTISCSFGVSEYASCDHQESMIVRADEALYVCKENGRNQVQYKLV